MQARVIVDFKAGQQHTFSEVMGQAQAELIVASSLSCHDVLVVFTDLNSVGHALRCDGDTLLLWTDLTPQQVVVWLVADFLRHFCASVAVEGVNDARVPGEPDAKRRRFSLVQKTHALVPRPSGLLEQLEAFNTGHWEDFLDGRDVVLSAAPTRASSSSSSWCLASCERAMRERNWACATRR